MGPRVQLPPEIQLAQRLAGNEQVTRDRAVRKLRKYIVARTQRAEGGRGVGGMWAGAPRRPGRVGGAGRPPGLGDLPTSWSLHVVGPSGWGLRRCFHPSPASRSRSRLSAWPSALSPPWLP